MDSPGADLLTDQKEVSLTVRPPPEACGHSPRYTDAVSDSDEWLSLIEINEHLTSDAKDAAEVLAANAVGAITIWTGDEIAEVLDCEFTGTWKVDGSAAFGEEWLATTGGLGRVLDAEGELIESGWLRPKHGSAAWTLTKGNK